MEKEKDGVRLAEGNFQITLQLTQRRSIVMSGYVYHGETADELNARLDAMQASIDRQETRCGLTEKELQRKALMESIDQFREQLEELAARKNARSAGLSKDPKSSKTTKLSSQEMAALENGQATIKVQLKNVAKLDAEIALAREKLGLQA